MQFTFPSGEGGPLAVDEVFMRGDFWESPPSNSPSNLFKKKVFTKGEFYFLD